MAIYDDRVAFVVLHKNVLVHLLARSFWHKFSAFSSSLWSAPLLDPSGHFEFLGDRT